MSEPAGERELREVEREVESQVQRLHDQGVINLDAPAREVVNVLQRHLENRPRDVQRYFLVGDEGWLHH